MADQELDDQAEFLSCIWDSLPDSWKSIGFQGSPKMMFILPSELNFGPPIDYWKPHGRRLGRDRHPITFEQLDTE